MADLQAALGHVSRVLQDSRAWANEKETCFEMLRRGLLHSSRLRQASPARRKRIRECVEPFVETQSRWRNILGQSPGVQEALEALDDDARNTFLYTQEQPEGHASEGSAVPAVNGASSNPFAAPTSGSNPFSTAAERQSPNLNPFQPSSAAPGDSRNPFATSGSSPCLIPPRVQAGSAESSPSSSKFANLSPKASVGSAVMSAALEPPRAQEPGVAAKISNGVGAAVAKTREVNAAYGITDKIQQGASSAATQARDFEQKHQVSARAAEAARGAVAAARDANQKYHITDRIGQGVKSAASATVEFEKKHQVTSRVASGVTTGAGKVASAASSMCQGSRAPGPTTNPFAQTQQQPQQQPPQPRSAVAGASKNPFAGPAQLAAPAAKSNPFRKLPY
eukprot:TRINITY_DN15959_c0_g1_i2.p1 TRINITY_DN15959_c0_g1~~TRINITY_DN15959_c0_g1_i2.p1  ORF type:complete len:394 (+),score=75.98 TRINITY_DN15959_c0_g1_i2:51-1232(+)